MRTFHCTCGTTIYFENSQCLTCGRVLGFLPERLQLSALEPEANGRHRALADGGLYRQCRNFQDQQVCNWMVPDSDPHPYCRACRLNQLIPNLSDARNRILWMRIERAKRRLLYGLYRLGLPVIGRDVDSIGGLAFEFLEEPAVDTEFADPAGGQHVLTGHRGGTITINIAEADPSARESIREQMGEQYRTLLGHFRHEIAHWYWDRLMRDSSWQGPFRELFGDERSDYAAALARYYAEGPRADWPESCVSAYASAHPWEDWAETWAHYLHMVDTLETAHDHGFALRGQALRPPAPAHGDTQRQSLPGNVPADFDDLLNDWAQLALALNALNRSMGMRDVYPFALGPGAIAKLRFVHRVIRSPRGTT